MKPFITRVETRARRINPSLVQEVENILQTDLGLGMPTVSRLEISACSEVCEHCCALLFLTLQMIMETSGILRLCETSDLKTEALKHSDS